MTPENIPVAFVGAFRRLVRCIQPRPLEPGTMGAYFAVLAPLPLATVVAAVDVLTQQPRRFFPSAGEWFTVAKHLQAAARLTPTASGEYPYDPTETFTEDEIADAAAWLSKRPCPHTPACPTARVCVEEFAWYLRHRAALEAAPAGDAVGEAPE